MSALYVSNARSNISRTGYETIESFIDSIKISLNIFDRVPPKYNFYDYFNGLYYI